MERDDVKRGAWHQGSTSNVPCKQCMKEHNDE
jgi:hypothetical protein